MADGDGTQADAGNICQTNCEQVPAKIATGKANSVEYDDVAGRQDGKAANGCNRLREVFPSPLWFPATASSAPAPATTAAPSDATLFLCLAKCGRQLKLIQNFSCAQRLPLQIVRATLKCTAHAASSSIRPATTTTTTTIAEAGATTSHLKATLTKCQNVKKRDFTQAEMSSRRRCSDKRANRAKQKEREGERGTGHRPAMGE